MLQRTFVIGDIHGGLKALEQVIDQLQLRLGDRLIFVGDYVDGWSQSAQVINYLLELEKVCPCIFIKGNHDIWCEKWLQTGIADNDWVFNGGQSTRDSYLSLTEETKARHLDFFNRMRNYYVDEQNRLFIHAGFSSMHGPDKEPYESNYSWDRTLWEMAVALNPLMPLDSRLYPKRLKHFYEIYIGHTPTLNYDVSVPMKGGNVWNVDTGAAFYGPLTAMNVDTREFWQSEPVKQLYPEEKGRNK